MRLHAEAERVVSWPESSGTFLAASACSNHDVLSLPGRQNRPAHTTCKPGLNLARIPEMLPMAAERGIHYALDLPHEGKRNLFRLKASGNFQAWCAANTCRPDRDSSHSHVPPTGLLHRHAARTLQAIHPHWECRSNCFKSVTPTERGLTVGWHVSNFNTDMSKSKSLPRKNNFMVHKYEYESWIEKVAQ